MSVFIINLLQGNRPTIYGTGEKRRDFIYVDDVTDFHLQSLDDPSGERITNLKIGDRVDCSLKIGAVKGLNKIVFRYKNWNNNKVQFAPGDPRTMAVVFRQLLIKPAS